MTCVNESPLETGFERQVVVILRTLNLKTDYTPEKPLEEKQERGRERKTRTKESSSKPPLQP